MAGKSKSKAGRPPKYEGERLRRVRTFRVRGSLDANLIKYADHSGRTVSEEIEYLLERAIDENGVRGTDTGKVIRMIQLAMQNESADGTEWSSDPIKAETVRTAVNIIIAAFANLPVAPPSTGTAAAKPGEILAGFVLDRGRVKLSRSDVSDE
jgi:hypothetical protein